MSQRIVITIEIPDGVGLEVGPSSPASGPAAIVADHSRCPTHHIPWKYVPGGVSARTGNAYAAFYACQEKDCNQRPPKGWEPERA